VTGLYCYTDNMAHHTTVEGLLEEIRENGRCSGCNCRFADINSFPAWSRYGHGDLCSDCGKREAFEGDFIRERILQQLARVRPTTS